MKQIPFFRAAATQQAANLVIVALFLHIMGGG